MPKTKSKLVQKTNVDKKILIAVAVLAAAIGFVIFQSHAATNTANLTITSLPGGAKGILLETLQYNSSGIHHSNGKYFYDTYYKPYNHRVWQAQAPNSGFAWWGPYHNYGDSAHFWACYAYRTWTSNGLPSVATPVLYMDVTSNAGRNNLNNYTMALPRSMGLYGKYCLRFTGATVQTEMRMKIKGGTINMGDISVYEETSPGIGIIRGQQPGF